MAGILEGIDQRTNLAGQNRLELLLFRLNTRQRFGINVFKVQEVIRCPQLSQLPGSHPVVRGIAKLRGKTISIIDLSLAVGGASLGEDENQFIILTEYNRRVQGFLVGSVDRIVNMTWGEIMPPPRGTGKGSYMTAVTRVDDELVEIIDVEKVMKEIVGGSETVSAGIIDEEVRNEIQQVLVVDDSAVARNQIKRVLDQLGVETTLCNDGGQALRQLQNWLDEGKDVEEFLSLVISDVEMPRMDGYTLTSEIRKHPRLANLHVVLHTSLSGVFNETMIKRVGANKFLAKYEPDELAVMVQEQIKDHKAARGALA
ncbi:MAG: chemotaxis protein CheV [Chromatiaceae bacterium]|nr:chemotaxis protein CheV [Gammaproteobacteria bacterium]MCP5427288.1 chemotaxis protein CheV [Chromatiaceae bacterium]MCB1862219.1 chemotaxis protein CheV [Gammaproteobacteria bacterium]MCB1871036.1 chemotaxis protein CheV [Gammaproteobacteria bacterium]MCB1879963.1 chemotaxis protein CheV [Gammaproteobacteria bacterium]